MSTAAVLPSPPSTSSRRKIPMSGSAATFSTPDTPASFPGSSSNGARKRVGFSPWTTGDNNQSPNHPPSTQPSVKSLPPSSECQSALKSILKPATTNAEPPQARDTAQSSQSVTEMMESICQQLSSEDRVVCVDAYQTLATVIRTYDEIPEEAVLKSKVTTILKFIKRDLLKGDKSDNAISSGTNLITSALKVLVIFVWNREYSALLSDEFRIFILDRSIQVIAEHTAPKSIIIHHLHLLATQDFRPGLMTSNNRIIRLLEALRVLTDHVTGNGAVSERVLVYHKLLDQAKSAMKTRAHLWVQELLSAMMSGMKDVRTKALALGVKACAAFPASASISVAVRMALEQELENGKTVSINMCRKLEKMIGAKEDVVQVPQIWAVVVLLSNSLDARIEDWSDFREWIKVIQRCFNSSETAVRQQSNIAWNRLVMVVRPHEASDNMMSMLAKPPVAQLERQSSEKAIKGSRATAVGSFTNLLYYAFRPAATHRQYTRAWNEYIVKVMKSSFFEKDSANADLAARVLVAMLWNANKSTKVWNENRANESRLVEPEELPTIDCKWIRAKSAAILDIFQLLLRYCSWGPSGNSSQSYIAVAWTHLLKAIREAGSKEIKQSLETRAAISAVVNFLQKLGVKNPTSVEQTPDFDPDIDAGRIQSLTRTAIAELGHTSMLVSMESDSIGESSATFIAELLAAMATDLTSTEKRMDQNAARSSIPVSHNYYEKALQLLSSSMLKVASVHDLHSRDLVDAMAAMEQVLRNTPATLALMTLTNITPALVAILRDDEHVYQSANEHEYAQLVKSTLRALSNAAPKDLEMLDQILAAAFSGCHSFVIDGALEMWTKTYGREVELPVGPDLTEAFRVLRNCAQVEIPGVTLPTESQARATTPPAAVLEAVLPSPSRSESEIQTPREDAPQSSPILGSQRFSIYDESGEVDETPERPVSRTKYRHDDSQLDFVEIRSSPEPVRAQETQYMTEHQKDVRDRQRSEPAVVFPDLRSSPRPQSKSQPPSECGFARKAAALNERPSTPTLPINHDQEMEPISSPTPRARHLATRIADIEVPSSPPSILDHQERAKDVPVEVSSPLQPPNDDVIMGIEIALEQGDIIQEDETFAPYSKHLGDMIHNEEAALMVVDQDQLLDDPPVQEQIQDDDDADQTPSALDNLLPSTVAETLEPAYRGHAGIPRSPTVEHGTDSDDIDMLSQSQLSQDLDRYTSFEGPVEDRTDGAVSPGEDSIGERRRRRRKRKSTDGSDMSTKRRRSETGRQTAAEMSANVPSPAKAGHDDDAEDCIVVSASSVPVEPQLQTVGTEEEFTAPAPAARKRGRPRKSRYSRLGRAKKHRSSQSSSIASSDPSSGSQSPTRSHDEEQVNDERTAREIGEEIDNGLDLDGDEDMQPPVEEPATAQEVSHDLANGEAPVVAPTTEVEHPAPITSVLQDLLGRVKSMTPGEIDLRAIDELCFQIRYEAQERVRSGLK